MPKRPLQDAPLDPGGTYTDQALANAFGRTRNWVLDNIIYPKRKGANGEYIEGVRHIVLGTQHQTTGRLYAEWLERISKGCRRQPNGRTPK